MGGGPLRMPWQQMATTRRVISSGTFFAAVTLACLPAGALGQGPVLDTPDKLWRDFRPDAPDLDTQQIRSWHEDQADFETLRFTAEREAEGRVRVFAIRGAQPAVPACPGFCTFTAADRRHRAIGSGFGPVAVTCA